MNSKYTFKDTISSLEPSSERRKAKIAMDSLINKARNETPIGEPFECDGASDIIEEMERLRELESTMPGAFLVHPETFNDHKRRSPLPSMSEKTLFGIPALKDASLPENCVLEVPRESWEVFLEIADQKVEVALEIALEKWRMDEEGD